jgi:hypothetical protein
MIHEQSEVAEGKAGSGKSAMSGANNSGSSSEIIGYSERRRPLIIKSYHGNATKESLVKVFILAGQHGDERYCKRAVARLISTLDDNSDYPKQFESLEIAILQDANPDGSAMKSRTNASGIDLNRDHQFLNAAETRSIHSFMRKWRPHLVIDVHNYPSKRKHLLDKGLVLHQDVFIDVPTNPGVFTNVHMDQKVFDQFLYKVQADLRLHGFSCERYSIIKPSGRVRHSTPDVVDARNFIALRYNALTVLLEGRTPTRDDGEVERESLVSAQLQALLSVLTWAIQNKDYLHRIREYLPTKGEKVPIKSRYAPAQQPLQMSFKSALSGGIEIVSLPKYTPCLEVTKQIDLPAAYAIPKDNEEIINILHRHKFVSRSADPSSTKIVQQYHIQSVEHSRRENRSPKKVAVTVASRKRKVDDCEVFPTDQIGGHSLAIMLEPESKYGIHRRGDHILSDSHYPVLRVL